MKVLGEFLLWLSSLRTQLVSMRTWVQSLGLLSGLRIQQCCRPASMALVPPLAWELPCATGAALKKKKNPGTCPMGSDWGLDLRVWLD